MNNSRESCCISVLPQPKQLWKHSSPQSTRMYEFMRMISKKYRVDLPEYRDLHRWSIDNVASFWEEVWGFTGVVAEIVSKDVLSKNAPMFPRPLFFPDARLNFAQNLLFPRCIDETLNDTVAVIGHTESAIQTMTWSELRQAVKACTSAMRSFGISWSHHVVGYLGNHINTLVAMLSATTLGATWSAISPDTGVHAVLERMQQIDPILLFTDNAVIYNGKTHTMLDKVRELTAGLPGLKAVVVFETVSTVDLQVDQIDIPLGKAWSYQAFISSWDHGSELLFPQFPPDHPVYILYSSGTTGKPKCIVHGALGTLIQHKKEHEIHCDLRPGDRLFYFTTTTWMMWHWLVSGLASGATIVLYDGSPFRPLDDDGHGELAMPRLIDSLGITHFGTSAKYLSILEQKDIQPRPSLPMKHLKVIYSTGSPLAPSTFAYVYRAFGPDINLASITGGTDIISLFGAPSPLSPVYAGEIQVRGLGMAVQVWDANHKDITMTGEPGELVCVKPFPSQPVRFFGIDGHEAYRKSYFEAIPGVWHHGDFVRLNPETEGMVMLGRSDGVLKPQGVRFGSAEIYNVLLEHFAEEVADALCVGRRRELDTDETVVLFLKMMDGHIFDGDIQRRVKEMMKQELSARHVPGIVAECPEIPVTTNGKKVEVAVKQILCGMNVKTMASIANADCLDWYRQWNREHP